MGRVPESVLQRIRDEYEAEREKLGIGWGKCFCGCGDDAPIAKWTSTHDKVVGNHPKRYVRHHAIGAVKAKRIKYVEKDCGYHTPCWLCQLKIADNGYAHITIGGRTKLAHRHYYETHKGPIPPGDTLDHLCAPYGGPRHCINPDHLEPCTMLENQRRGRGAKMSVELVYALKEAHSKGVEIPTLVMLTGVSKGTIRGALDGYTWKDVG